MKRTATFALERQTKGAVLYKEIDPQSGAPKSMGNAVIGSLYVRKSSIGSEPIPQYIEVTVVTTEMD